MPSPCFRRAMLGHYYQIRPAISKLCGGCGTGHRRRGHDLPRIKFAADSPLEGGIRTVGPPGYDDRPPSGSNLVGSGEENFPL
jgi:hypothetical protein